jgi:hypothetical protein
MSEIFDPSPAPAASRSLRRTQWFVVIGGLLALGLGVWLVVVRLPRLLTTVPAEDTPPVAETSAAPAEGRKIHATLFYVSDDGSELVAVSQEVPYAPTAADQARRIAEAQVGPAPAGSASAIPPGTSVRALYLTPRGEAYVDLSREIISAHPGGSLNEALSVFALVNALTVNLPDVSAVQILVDGKEVDTLAGHLDLRHPLAKSLKWVRRGQ